MRDFQQRFKSDLLRIRLRKFQEKRKFEFRLAKAKLSFGDEEVEEVQVPGGDGEAVSGDVDAAASAASAEIVKRGEPPSQVVAKSEPAESASGAVSGAATEVKVKQEEAGGRGSPTEAAGAEGEKRKCLLFTKKLSSSEATESVVREALCRAHY